MLDRKLLKRPDGLTRSIRSFFESIYKHNRAFIGILLGMTVIGGVVAFIVHRLDHASEEGRNALYSAEKALEEETQALNGKPTPVPSGKGESPKTSEALVLFKKLDVDASFPETVKKLKKVDSEHGNTRPAYEARMKLGNLYYDHGDFEKSIPWYEKALNSAPGKFEKAQTLSALGYASENLGKGNAALQSYQKALDLGEASLKGDLLLAMARCYELTHDSAKAKSTYDRIIADLPNTDYAKTAEALKN